MKKITYVKGEYSQTKLDDGSKIFIETLPEKIRVKGIFLGLIPTKTIWEYKFPFYIRTVGGAWETAIEILDLVLQSMDNCKTIEELHEKLRDSSRQVLDGYVDKNKMRALDIGFKQLGKKALEKNDVITREWQSRNLNNLFNEHLNTKRDD